MRDMTIYINFYPYENEADEKALLQLDKYAQRDLERLAEAAEKIKEYRKKLFEHTQSLQNEKSRLELKIRRYKRYNGAVSYYITLTRQYEKENMYKKIIDETYTGQERHTAIARYKALKKEYPNITHIEELEKNRWER